MYVFMAKQKRAHNYTHTHTQTHKTVLTWQRMQIIVHEESSSLIFKNKLSS